MDLNVYLQLRNKALMLKPKVKESFVKQSLTEDVLKELWYKQELDRRNLLTTSGEKLVVLSPGEKHTLALPDFISAKIVVDGKHYEGDVEVHFKRSDWFKHKHSERYSNIILHVFYDYDTKREIKEVKFEVCLKGRLTVEDVQLYAKLTELDAEFSGSLCGEILMPKDYNYLEELIIAAAEARLLLKSEVFSRWINFDYTEEQTLYEEMAEVYGYVNNKDNFVKLARLVPIKKLKQVIKSLSGFKPLEVIESIYFGVAGFIDDAIIKQPANCYTDRLVNIWNIVKDKFKKRLSISQWRFYKTRPVNFPQRRIAAFSRTISNFVDFGLHKILKNFLNNFTEEEIIKHLINIFYQPSDGFFARHCSFDSKQFPKEYPLFGEEKVAAIVVNVVLPYYFYHARKNKNETLKQKVISIYKKLKLVEKNTIVEKFVSSIIRYTEYRKYFLSHTMFVQGFLQLYRDFCEPIHGRCEDCYLVRILREKINKLDDELYQFKFIIL